MARVDVPQKRDSPRGVVGASMSSSTERADSGGRRKRRSRIVCGLCTALSTRFSYFIPAWAHPVPPALDTVGPARHGLPIYHLNATVESTVSAGRSPQPPHGEGGSTVWRRL